MRSHDLPKHAWPICSTCHGAGKGCYNQYCEDGHTVPEERTCEVCDEIYVESECEECEKLQIQDEKWLSVSQAAAQSGVSPPIVYKMIADGLINRTNKIAGRNPRKEVRLSDVEAFRNLGVRDD